MTRENRASALQRPVNAIPSGEREHKREVWELLKRDMPELAEAMPDLARRFSVRGITFENEEGVQSWPPGLIPMTPVVVHVHPQDKWHLATFKELAGVDKRKTKR